MLYFVFINVKISVFSVSVLLRLNYLFLVSSYINYFEAKFIFYLSFFLLLNYRSYCCMYTLFTSYSKLFQLFTFLLFNLLAVNKLLRNVTNQLACVGINFIIIFGRFLISKIVRIRLLMNTKRVIFLISVVLLCFLQKLFNKISKKCTV